MTTKIEIVTAIYEVANARRFGELASLVEYPRLQKRLRWFFERITALEPNVRFVVSNAKEEGSTATFDLTLEGTRLPHERATQAMRFKGMAPMDLRNVFTVPDSPNAICFGGHHVRSPMLTDLLDKIADIPGFFTYDDCVHFSLILRMQSSLGLAGDALEFGPFHGRSTAVIAQAMQSGETIVVCDLFELDGSDVDYTLTGRGRPSPEIVQASVAKVCPDPGRAPKLEIHRCFSSELALEPVPRFRFVHVDGGHDEAVALGDLLFSADRLLPGGVISVDDYAHLYYPGVTAAVDRFLAERTDFHVLADVNRITETGRKQYLVKRLPRGRA